MARVYSYKYAPLRYATREIRLFDLDPWTVDNSEIIELRMTITELEHAGNYICLSYTWGDASKKHGIIKIDGVDFAVGENLHGALLRLRQPDSPRRLWVDAICINQDDTVEREAQVSIMQHIFHSATEVIAWVGEDNGASDERAIDFLYQLSSRATAYFGLDRLGSGSRESIKSSWQLDKETLEWIESVTPLGLANSKWLDLTALLSRPWFSRIWIVQEVVMGQKVTVYCGRHQLEWGDIYFCATFVCELAKIIIGIAAPRCLQVHDADKCNFFYQSQSGFRLLVAMENIKRVGYLASRKLYQRSLVNIAKPAIDAYKKSTQRQNQRPGRLWGFLSPDSRKFWLAVSMERHTPDARSESQGNVTSSTPLEPPLGDPHFINQHLPESLSAKELVVYVDGNIPIYTTRRSTDTNEAFKRRGLWALINEFRSFKSSDPRDKIYALLGIAADVQHIAPLPPISYQVGVFETFWELIAAELRGGGKLGFLSAASGLDRPEGFPSWMPLWYFNMDHWTSEPLDAFESEPHIEYRAAGNTAPRASSAREDKTLTVLGAFVGRIEKIGNVFDRDADDDQIKTIRAEWADMTLAGKVERVSQRLLGLLEAGRISKKEASARFRNYLRHHRTENTFYNEFRSTLLASVNEAGDSYLANPPQEVLPPITGHWLPNGQRVEDRQSPSQSFISNRTLGICHGRRLFVCDAGNGRKKVGLAPRSAQVGDEVAMFLGADLLYIARETDTVNGLPTFGLVGEAYVHGWMGGELLVGSPCKARAIGQAKPLECIDIQLR